MHTYITVLLTLFTLAFVADVFWFHDAACKDTVCFEEKTQTYKSNKACRCQWMVMNSIDAATHNATNNSWWSWWYESDFITAWYDICTSNRWGDGLKFLSIDHVVCGSSGKVTYSSLHHYGLQSRDQFYYLFNTLFLILSLGVLVAYSRYFETSKHCSDEKGVTPEQVGNDTYHRHSIVSKLVHRVALGCHVVVVNGRDMLMGLNRFYTIRYLELWFDLQSLKGTMQLKQHMSVFASLSFVFVTVTHVTIKNKEHYFWWELARKASLMACVWCMMETLFVHTGRRLAVETLIVCVAMVITSAPSYVLQGINPVNYLITVVVKDGEWHQPSAIQIAEIGAYISWFFGGIMYKAVAPAFSDHFQDLLRKVSNGLGFGVGWFK
jgi:hypothetical protein